MHHPDSKVSRILNILSDSESIELLMAMSLAPQSSNYDVLGRKLKLTRKQFYSRSSSFTKIGIVERIQGKYCLTSFGKLILHAIEVIEDAINIYMRLKAIDMMDISEQITKEEIVKLIDTLIIDKRVKDIVKGRYHLEE